MPSLRIDELQRFRQFIKLKALSIIPTMWCSMLHMYATCLYSYVPLLATYLQCISMYVGII